MKLTDEELDTWAEEWLASYRERIAPEAIVKMSAGALAVLTPEGQAMLRVCARHGIEVELA